jgi:hypothetical protein
MPQDFEAIQEQIAQLRSNLVELGQTLLAWGQYELGAARNGLTAKAEDLGDALSNTVEAARKQGNKVAEAVSYQQQESRSAPSLAAISAGVGALLLLIGGVSWAAKRLSR